MSAEQPKNPKTNNPTHLPKGYGTIRISLESCKKIINVALKFKGKKLRRFYDESGQIRPKMQKLIDKQHEGLPLSEKEKIELALKLHSSVIIDKKGIPYALGTGKGWEIGKTQKTKVKALRRITMEGLQGYYVYRKSINKMVEAEAPKKDLEVDIGTKMGLHVDKILVGESKEKIKEIDIQVFGGNPLIYHTNISRRNKDILNFEERLSAMKEASRKLDELHTVYRTIHRDLKEENILIDKNTGKVTFVDFELAKKLPKNGIIVDSIANSPNYKPPGTDGYIAPESYSQGEFSKASDCYALGIIIQNMCVAQNIEFFEKNYIKTNPRNIPIEEARKKAYAEMQIIGEELIAPDPKKRLTANEAFIRLQKTEEDLNTTLKTIADKKMEYLLSKTSITPDEISHFINACFTSSKKEPNPEFMDDLNEYRQAQEIYEKFLVENNSELSLVNAILRLSQIPPHIAHTLLIQHNDKVLNLNHSLSELIDTTKNPFLHKILTTLNKVCDLTMQDNYSTTREKEVLLERQIRITLYEIKEFKDDRQKNMTNIDLKELDRVERKLKDLAISLVPKVSVIENKDKEKVSPTFTLSYNAKKEVTHLPFGSSISQTKKPTKR